MLYTFGKRKAVLLSVLVFIIFAGLSLSYIESTRKSLLQEAETTLKQVASQGAATVSLQFEKDIKILKSLTHIFSPRGMLTEKARIEMLDEEAKRNGFKRISYAYQNANAYSSDGFRFSVSEREYFHHSMLGKDYISDTLDDKLGSGGRIVVFSVPLWDGDEVVGVIFATKSVDTLMSAMDVNFFSGLGNTFIMDGEGTAVVHTNHAKIGTDFLEVIKTNNDAIEYEALLGEMNRRISSSMSLQMPGEKQFLGYAPIKTKPNWYFLTSISSDIILAQSNKIINRALFNSFSLMALLMLIFSYILGSRKRYEKELRTIAYTDELTKIWNLKKFLLETQAAINTNKGAQYGIGYFDINNFKSFNDMFGYDFGDKLLIAIAHILEDLALPSEFYARVGNDNFLMFYKAEGEETTAMRADKFIRATEEIVIDGRKIDIKMSMGFYTLTEEDTDIHLAINKANMARGMTKHNNQNPYAFYSDDIRSNWVDTAKLESELRHAIKAKEFMVYQQPKFDLKTREPVGTEALIRWNPQGKGFVSPAEFIPVAEKCGIILDIGRFVFETVCRDIHHYQEQGIDFLPVSVNLSRVELYQGDLLDFVKETMARYEISPSLIEIELTETAALEDLDYIKKIIMEFKNMGLSVSMDDFGTGFSSLSCLKSIPIDILKLDRSFIIDIDEDERSRNIAKFVVFLVKSLGLSVIAEGVETKEQTEFLESIGCDMVQGYYFAHPMPVEEAITFMKSNNQHIK